MEEEEAAAWSWPGLAPEDISSKSAFSHTQVVVPAGHDQDSLPGASWEQGLLKS